MDDTQFAELRSDPLLASLFADSVWQASQADELSQFLMGAMPPMLAATGADFLVLAAPEAGRWLSRAETGRKQNFPPSLLADALDLDDTASADLWLAAPIAPRGAKGDVLAGYFATTAKARDCRRKFGLVARSLGRAVEMLRGRLLDRRRIHRLEEILGIASNWNKTQEMEPLLVQMAEAATRLLGADRASIFLWDKPNHLLVGRPALGVEGGELRIRDDAGIVGQVIHSGEPRRAGPSHDQEQIDRQVDKKLGYQTRTLLCVPLRSRNGELFGAFEVINKKRGAFTDEDESALVELASHAAIALENTQERTNLLRAKRQIADQAAAGVRLIGESSAMAHLRATIARLARTDLAVLILGENGTGKEVVSQSIHYLSERRDQPFIAVNCAAISETLLESELFGHEKGAFTDAREARAGKFELASGGTLFLDEIGDLSLGGQAKLLRVLEEKLVVRVGGSVPIHTDARVIAATNQNLPEMVRQKRFRQDLLFRLNVVTLELPPLRERRQDVLLLAEHFLQDFSRKARRAVPRFSAEARHRLETHAWPGNVRELRNLMERLAYLSSGDTIEAADLAFILTPTVETPVGASVTDRHLAEATDLFQIDHIRAAIARSKGNMSEAAERLGLHRSNLYRKMRQLGMKVDESE